MWISFRKFQEQMTESCYPSVPLSLQFNCSMSLYSLSVQSNQKKENNQEVHLSLRNKNKTNCHISCFVLTKDRSAVCIVPSSWVDLFDSCQLVDAEILFSELFLLLCDSFFFFSRYGLKTHVDQFFSISSCFPKFSHVDVPQKRKQV